MKLIDWLGFDNFRYENAPKLGRFIGYLLSFIALAFVVSGFVALIKFIAALLEIGSYYDSNSDMSVRNIGLVLVGLFGAPFLAWRSIIAARQVALSEELLQ